MSVANAFRVTEWQNRAACRNGYDPEAWFPVSTSPEAQVVEGEDAIKVCWFECPVRELCLEWALATEAGGQLRCGILGGLLPVDRAAEVRRRYRRQVKKTAAEQARVESERANIARLVASVCKTAPTAPDDAVVERLIAGEPVEATRAERLTAVALMRADEFPNTTIADRLRKDPKQVERDLRDLGLTQPVTDEGVAA